MNGKTYTENDLEYYNELWFSWDHHSSFSDTDRENVLRNINASVKKASEMLYQADYLLAHFWNRLGLPACSGPERLSVTVIKFHPESFSVNFSAWRQLQMPVLQ